MLSSTSNWQTEPMSTRGLRRVCVVLAPGATHSLEGRSRARPRGRGSARDLIATVHAAGVAPDLATALKPKEVVQQALQRWPALQEQVQSAGAAPTIARCPRCAAPCQ